MVPHSFNRYKTVAALDIGSFKVCCVIARINRDTRVGEKIRIVGYGCAESKGIKSGVVIDINQAAMSICNAVEMAEQQANERISKVIINISTDKARSSIRHSVININKNRTISGEDMSKVLAAGMSKVNISGYETIHCMGTNYQVDNSEFVKDPRGLYAEKLGIDILLGVLPDNIYRNIVSVVEGARLSIDAKIFSAYADGLACLVEDEKEIGATIIDIGGGITNIATFHNGFPVQFSSIPVGGNHITSDIAWGLNTSFKNAESLKTLHGCTMLTSKDKNENINIYPMGEEDDSSVRSVPKSDLINIITIRVEELFELVSKKLDEHGLKNVSNHRVVLTGGTSHLVGIRNTASIILDKQVRIGVPRNIVNMPQNLCSPEYSTAIGILMFAVNLEDNDSFMEYEDNMKASNSSTGFLSRIFKSLKQNF